MHCLGELQLVQVGSWGIAQLVKLSLHLQSLEVFLSGRDALTEVARVLWLLPIQGVEILLLILILVLSPEVGVLRSLGKLPELLTITSWTEDAF